MKTPALLLAALFAIVSAIPCRAGNESPAPAVAPQKAVFSMGCFWCAQDPYDKVRGVVSTLVGYTGGTEKNPTYELVSTGQTGYRESIEVTYDPSKVSYDQLLDVFWHHINPTQTDGQFADRDHQYTTAIYYLNDEQKKAAEASRERLAKSGKFSKPIATAILPAMTFWPAEEHHQKYYQKNPEDYESYHVGSGRVDYLNRVWGSAQ
jgi:methionine-S-sulfoxide reductase